uniref:Uncharacterized protein n=1 Tax=Nelumbo nucifera TaxID=4432 RepID=A0A822ZV78_NELNU|nr:TPA_asm: hypothetical protein HUJ06_016713 [Nelumbo nucifera]
MAFPPSLLAPLWCKTPCGPFPCLPNTFRADLAAINGFNQWERLSWSLGCAGGFGTRASFAVETGTCSSFLDLSGFGTRVQEFQYVIIAEAATIVAAWVEKAFGSLPEAGGRGHFREKIETFHLGTLESDRIQWKGEFQSRKSGMLHFYTVTIKCHQHKNSNPPGSIFHRSLNRHHLFQGVEVNLHLKGYFLIYNKMLLAHELLLTVQSG